MCEQAFQNIDDVLWKEAGCTTELNYTGRTSWLLFQKYLGGLEQDKADAAALDGKKYILILNPYRSKEWAAPKGTDGEVDDNNAKTGDHFHSFVNQKLFPYVHGFKQKARGPNTIEYTIGKAGGRAVVVVKNTFLSNTDNASASLRKTREVWFYQFDPGRNLGKTNPLNDADPAGFVALQMTFADSPKSWSAVAKTIDQATFDLSVKNSNGGEAVVHHSAEYIMDEIAAGLETIRGLP